MPGTLFSVIRGRAFAVLDRWLAEPTQAKIDQLKTGKLVEVALANRPADFTNAAALRKHAEEVLGDDVGWWPTLRGKEEILRAGFLQAWELAKPAPGGKALPIATLWVAGATEEFEIVLSRTDAQVTMIWMTPKQKPHDLPRAGDTPGMPDDIYTVAPEARIAELVRKFGEAGYAADPPTRFPEAPGVMVMRSIGY